MTGNATFAEFKFISVLFIINNAWGINVVLSAEGKPDPDVLE